MTDRTKYFIWLSLCLGFESPKPLRLLSLYTDIKELYDGAEQEFRYCGIFTEREINNLIKTDICEAEHIINRCRELNYDIIDISEDSYPESLRNIETPPAVLYVDGVLPDTDSFNTISIIGTRKATVYGVKTAFELAANLTKKDLIVVSGGALGIDCAAHRGALSTKGKTICVLGCGIDYDYLRENKAMRKQITENGAVISEYPPGTPSSARNFPQRNRIISGLSQGTVVVEAPMKSGSMITVNLALSQNKDVFAVMGNVDSPYSEGSNTLIKDGAIPVTSYRDIYEFYCGVNDISESQLKIEESDITSVPSKLKGNRESANYKNTLVPTHKSNVNLSEDEKTVYYCLGNEPMHIDAIIDSCEMPAYKILRIVSSLEIKDLIKNTEGRNYVIK